MNWRKRLLNHPELNPKNVLVSLFASLTLLSGFQKISNGPTFDCGTKIVTSLFDESTHIRLARNEFAAFDPLIEQAFRSGVEPQFAFRAQCGNLVLAGVKEHHALPHEELRAKVVRDSAWLGVHTTAAVVHLCELRLKGKNGAPYEGCAKPSFTMSLALSEIVRHERTTWIPTLMEYQMLNEFQQLERSPQMSTLVAGTVHRDAERALGYINEVTQNLYVDLHAEAIRSSLASIAANAEKSFLKSLRSRKDSVN
jgi:hypothetical protein